MPYEKKNEYKPNDINFHLYTWSEMNLGNLFTHAGFKVLKVEELKHKWPPYFIRIRKFTEEKMFNTICKAYGIYKNNISQVKIEALKPSH